MPYISTKRRKINGIIYDRGEPVNVSALPPHKLGSLVRLGLLVQADRAIEANIDVGDDPVEAPTEALCPHCGDGPFKRVETHIARIHPDVDDDDEDAGEEQE